MASLDDLDCVTADAFFLIDHEVDSWKMDMAKKAAEKMGKKGRR